MLKRGRIALSIAVYIGFMIITLSFAKESWSNTFYFLFCFGLPAVIVYAFWYIKDKHVIQRLKHSKDSVTSAPEETSSDREMALIKRESALLDRENFLDERERDIEKKYRDKINDLTEKQAYVDTQMRLFRDERSNAEHALRELQKYQTALERTEQRVLSWVKLREAEDIETFNAMRGEADKYQKYAEVSPDMDGFKFEEYTATLLRNNGYTDVVTTQKSRDFGADVTATYNGVRYVFQCKYYTVPVGIAAVQEIRSAKDFYSAHVAVVVTNSVFTKAAKILADEIGVILWDGEKLNELANNQQVM